MTSDPDATEPVTVTVTLTRAEVVGFNMRFALSRSRLLFYGGIWLAMVLYALYGIPMLAPGRANSDASTFAAVVTTAAMLVCIPLGTYIGARRRWDRAPELREPRQYTFTSGGIQVTGETFAGFVAWSHIVRAGRVAGLFYLGTNQNQFHVIPVSAFGSDEELERFRRLVAEHVKDCRL
jgi:hypothetical protein